MAEGSDRFLRACRRQRVDTTPVWIMRQAGRYLPQYREVRRNAGSFLALCKTPELACRVTLQPIDLLGVDAAILFSDILIPLQAMGMSLDFVEGEGPVLDRVRDTADLNRLRIPVPEEELPFVAEAVSLIRRELSGKVPLIGFCGAPFTLACYALEGGGTKDFKRILGWLYGNPEGYGRLMDLLCETVIVSLRAQVAAGVQAVQLFDTWAGVLSRRLYRDHALPWVRKVFAGLRDLEVPLILYVNGCAPFLEDMAGSGADVLSVDWRVSLAEAQERTRGRVALQGNLDPRALYAPASALRREILAVLAEAPASGHIFNLGHGVLPDTPVEAVQALVETVHEAGRGGDLRL